MLFLDSDELRELTGFKLASRQCQWLTDNGYPFDTTHSGKPKVLQTYLQQRLCPLLNTSSGIEQPNFDAIR